MISSPAQGERDAMAMAKNNLYFINPIYIKLAKIANSHCVIRKEKDIEIPIARLSGGMFGLFLADGNCRREININQRLYDNLASRGIGLDFIHGYFVIDKLSTLMQVVEDSIDLGMRFKSSTAQ